jgi:1-acyl-sn-glycerol-3-phosphate acyltransferase
MPMIVTRSIRLTRAALHILAAVVRVSVIFPWCGPAARRRQIATWSRRALDIFHLAVVTNPLPSTDSGSRLFVANHVSWLDVFAVWSLTDTKFVAKTEVGYWPVIGHLARRLGVIFIDRSKRKDAMKTCQKVATTLAQGRSVCIFPEGTSTEGHELHLFHPALFQPAVEVGVPVQPIAIRYFRRDGTHAAEAAFTGTMSLLQSMWRLAGAEPIVVEISHLPLIEASGSDRRVLAQLAHDAVRQRLRDPVAGWPVPSIDSATYDHPSTELASLNVTV